MVLDTPLPTYRKLAICALVRHCYFFLSFFFADTLHWRKIRARCSNCHSVFHTFEMLGSRVVAIETFQLSEKCDMTNDPEGFFFRFFIFVVWRN